VTALYGLSSTERAAVRKVYPNLEDELDAEFHRTNRIRNAHTGGASSHRVTTFDPDAAKPAPFDSSQYWIGARPNVPHGTASSADLQRAALNSTIGTGPARPAAPARPVAHGSGPSGAGKSRHLGGSVRK
jgi:hypothetical protein